MKKTLNSAEWNLLRAAVVFAVVLSCAPIARAEDGERSPTTSLDYLQTTKFRLHKSSHGVDGWLVMNLRHVVDTENVSLEVKDDNGVILSSDVMNGAPLSTLYGDTHYRAFSGIGGAPPWMELTLYSYCDRGMWCGPHSYFVRVNGGKLEYLTAIDAETGHEQRIDLRRSGDSNWRLVSDTEIQYVTNGRYGLLYRNQDKWIRRENKFEPDYFESYGPEDFEEKSVLDRLPKRPSAGLPNKSRKPTNPAPGGQ